MTETGTELVAVMPEAEARRLTEQIRRAAFNYAETKAQLMSLVQEAKNGNAHAALGYESWTAYLTDTLGDEPMQLARDDRRDFVRALTAEGMSTRAIAPIVGVSQSSIRDDLKVSSNYSPTPDPPDPVPVHGLDGKTYQPRPLLDAAALREREEAAAKRQNDEKINRTTCSALMTLAQFQYPNNRAWTIRAMHDYPEAVPKTYHEFHTPAVIRDIAEWLRLYANELEAQNAA